MSLPDLTARPSNDDNRYLDATRRAYRRVFGGNVGKAVLADIAAFARVMEPTYAANDPHQTAFNEGARSVALRIYAMLNMTAADAAAIADGWQRKQYDNPLGEDDE